METVILNYCWFKQTDEYPDIQTPTTHHRRALWVSSFRPSAFSLLLFYPEHPIPSIKQFWDWSSPNSHPDAKYCFKTSKTWAVIQLVSEGAATPSRLEPSLKLGKWVWRYFHEVQWACSVQKRLKAMMEPHINKSIQASSIDELPITSSVGLLNISMFGMFWCVWSALIFTEYHTFQLQVRFLSIFIYVYPSKREIRKLHSSGV